MELKRELIKKIQTITKETNQNIPILYNLSYFKTLIKSIYSLETKDQTDNILINYDELRLSENQSIYIFKDKKDIDEFIEKNLHIINRELNENILEDKSQKLSSTSLPTFQNPNNYEMKNIYYNISGIEDGVKEFKNFKETIDKELISNDIVLEKLQNSNMENIESNEIYNQQENQDYIENTEFANLLKTEFLKKVCVLCTDPPLEFNNFELSDLIHINFGEVTFTVNEITDKCLKCKCLNSGKIKLNNTFSVEGKDHFLSSLIEIDENNLTDELFDAINLNVDFIVISIINEPNKEIE